MSDEKWHKFGERAVVSYEELADIGRALIGSPPRFHEWIKFNKDRTAYQIGLRCVEEQK